VPDIARAAAFAPLITLSFTDPAGASTPVGSPTIELGGTYAGEVLRNYKGGLARGTTYLDNLDLTLGIDGEALWNVAGLRLFAYGLYNNGATFSDRFSGDSLTVSNIDTEGTARLFEAWADWSPGATGRLSLRIGLQDLNAEFDTTEARGLFVNSAYGIGHELGQTGQNGPSIFPIAGLAARLAWQPSDSTLLKLAAFDGVPGDPDDPRSSEVRLSGDDGALIVGELTATRGRLAQLSVGYWRYTADFEPLAAGQSARNDGAYVTMEFDLREATPIPRLGALFLRAGEAASSINEFDRFYAAGLTFEGLLLRERGDQLGIAVGAARASRLFQDLLAAERGDAERFEYNIELTWRVAVTDFLMLQPYLQHIVNPGVNPGLDDAMVLGVRAEVGLTWRWSRP
jgi:porin